MTFCLEARESREASGVIMPEFEGLRHLRDNVLRLSQKAQELGAGRVVNVEVLVWVRMAQELGAPMSKGRRRWMSQLKQTHTFSTVLFYSVPQHTG